MLHVLVSLLPWHVTPRPPPFKRRGRPILQVLAHALPGRSQEMQQQQRLKKANRMDMTVMEAKLLSAVLAQLQGQLKSLPPPPCSCIQAKGGRRSPAACCPMNALIAFACIIWVYAYVRARVCM